MAKSRSISSTRISKYLQSFLTCFTIYSNEEKIIERLEEEEEKKQAAGAEEVKIEEESKIVDTDSRWKNKFITIWKLNE